MKKLIIGGLATIVLAGCIAISSAISQGTTGIDEAGENDSLFYFEKNTSLPDGIAVFAEDGGETADISPAMWKVTAPNRNVMYMIGAMHISKDSAYPLPDYIKEAYEKCDKVATEINNVDSDLFRESYKPDYRLEDGDSLKKHLTEETYALLKEQLAKNDKDISDYDNFAPWYVYSEIITFDGENSEFSSATGLDRIMQIQANIDDKEILNIETAEAKDTMYSSLPEDVLDLQIKLACKNADKQEQSFEEMYSAWSTGDLDKLYDLTYDYSDVEDDETEVMQRYYRQFVIDRSYTMAEKAKEWLEEDYTVFYMAGASHFVGDEGIIALLEKDGYTCERIDE